MKLVIVATLVIAVCSFAAATNTEKHLKSRSAAHPAHLRSNSVHPVAHNARSKSLNKRVGDDLQCYKICAYESGDNSSSSLIVYISQTRNGVSSVNAIYVSSLNFLFIYDYTSKLIVIINTRTYASLIFNYSSGIGYYYSGSVSVSGIFSQSSNETVVEYLRSIEYSLNATWSVYVRYGRRFTLSLEGSFSQTAVEARILLSAFTRAFWNYSGTYSLSRWETIVISIHTQITAVFYRGYGVYEIRGDSYYFFLYHLINGGFNLSGGGSSSGGGTGSSGTGGNGSGGSGESGSGSGSGSGESGSGSDSSDSDESRRLTQNKNRISRSKLRSYHNQHNLKARDHH